ncbi:MAG: hypothetical protein D3925_08580 [Candidatus Electrothrix sp. AR5]|nr:hypothetical protein [Candidatus Electrothrix sp. AR5]
MGLGETPSQGLASKKRTEIVFSSDRSDRLKENLKTAGAVKNGQGTETQGARRAVPLLYPFKPTTCLFP